MSTQAPDSPELPSFETVFAPVRSQTAFEETLERLGTAIKLGLLAPGARLPAERELCTRLEISRSTLRQALTALAQSGHLHAVRGRGGGTFVSERPPPRDPPSSAVLASWHDACDVRLAVELGIACASTSAWPRRPTARAWSPCRPRPRAR
jgi:DNA-binding FadR family transcriptional regulator